MAGSIPDDPDYQRFVDPITGDDDIATSEDGPIDELHTVIENEDGSADVHIDDGIDYRDADFMENLADFIEEAELKHIAIDLLDLIENDKEARRKRDEQYAEGIKRTGLGNEAPGGAEFDGASRVVHPVMAEGCIDFGSRCMKEVFPPSGPCKTQIIGEATEAKVEKAERKKKYMNWQLTTRIRECRSEYEQMLTQLPLGGSQYLKIWYDDYLQRPRVEFVPIDEMILPFSVSDFYSAHRKTHMQKISRQVFESRVRSGLYRDIDVITPGVEGETASKTASRKIEGNEPDIYNDDGLRTIYEIYANYAVEDPEVAEGNEVPYIITVDEATRTVLSIYRNWEEKPGQDPAAYHEPLDWIVEYKFIPWRGAYGIGLPHIIGSLSGALTGALRAYLDSLLINNSQTMLALKGSRKSGQTINLEQGSITEIEGMVNVDDIRKMAMPLPFNPPSPAMLPILQWMTDQAKGVVATAEEAIKDAGNDMPVGTALALIEQGSTNYSAIHSRQHASNAVLLRILHRINKDHVQDTETIDELGDLVVTREDFQGPMDIVPVSDPNIFSEAQRYAQLQAALQLKKDHPQDFKGDSSMTKRALQMIGLPNYEELLVDAPEPEKLDAIHENAKASEGKQPLKAYDDQDHLSHMATHLHYALSPLFCNNPIMAIPAMPALLAHCKEHLSMYYVQNVMAATAATADVMASMGQLANPDESKTQLQASALADERMAQETGPLMDMMKQVAEAIKQFSPPVPGVPMDPNKQADIAAKTAIAQQEVASRERIAQQKMQQEAQQDQADNALEANNARLASEAELHQTQLDMTQATTEMNADIQRNRENNLTKLAVAEMGSASTELPESPSLAEQGALGVPTQTLAAQIVTHPVTGEVMGVRKGNAFHPAIRDANQNIVGLGAPQG